MSWSFTRFKDAFPNSGSLGLHSSGAHSSVPSSERAGRNEKRHLPCVVRSWSLIVSFSIWPDTLEMSDNYDRMGWIVMGNWKISSHWSFNTLPHSLTPILSFCIKSHIKSNRSRERTDSFIPFSESHWTFRTIHTFSSFHLNLNSRPKRWISIRGDDEKEEERWRWRGGEVTVGSVRHSLCRIQKTME